MSFLPVFINKQNQPQVLSRQDARFDEVRRYMQLVGDDQRLGTGFSAEGDEVVVNV